MDTTFGSVSQRLKTIIEGIPTQFSDTNLSQITDIGKLRKTYKLAAPKEDDSRRSDDGSAAPKTSEDGELERRELEASILGLMALRGAV